MQNDGNTTDEVLDKAVQGDIDAFSQIYDRYVGKIYNYIYYRTGNTLDAEDLTAKVFYRAFNHIQSFQNKGIPVSAWLYRIAHNLVANWHRDNSRKKEIPLEDHFNLKQNLDHPEREMMRNQEHEMVLNLIKTLPAERQQLVILKFVEGLSNAEIGMIMGRSEGAIKSLYHRTLVTLRDKVDNTENKNKK